MSVTGYRYICTLVQPCLQAGFYGDAVECLTATREIRVRSPSGSGLKIFFFTCHMRKPTFCICENKDADQLCGNRFVSDLIGNPEDRFSHSEAHIKFFGLHGRNK